MDAEHTSGGASRLFLGAATAAPPRLFLPVLLTLLAALWLAGCTDKATPTESLTILACPEAKAVEPAILSAALARRLDVQMRYKSPVDIMLDLQAPHFPCDAVLAANFPWIALGDTRGRVLEEASIMHSPVILGLQRQLAESLGWMGHAVSMAEILAAVEAGALRFAMASATQTSSGAAACMGMLLALSRNSPLTEAVQLQDPLLRQRLAALLAGVDRSAGGSLLLKDLFLSHPLQLQAMWNDEALLLATNLALADQGHEPLQLVYPADGLALADFTLGFVERSDNKHKRDRFTELRNTLLEPDAQQAFTAAGYRTALLGMNPRTADRRLFNPDWGVDLARPLTPIRWPEPVLLREALTLYQTELRKPSCTVYLLDARAPSLSQRKEALAGLLDPVRASQTMLQAASRDVTILLPFDSQGIADAAAPWSVQGHAPEALLGLRSRVEALAASPAGEAALLPPLQQALDLLLAQGPALQDTLPSVILITGGNTTLGSVLPLWEHWQHANASAPMPPCYVVTSDAEDPATPDVFHPLTSLSAGRHFDGHGLGVAAALRLARAGN